MAEILQLGEENATAGPIIGQDQIGFCPGKMVQHEIQSLVQTQGLHDPAMGTLALVLGRIQSIHRAKEHGDTGKEGLPVPKIKGIGILIADQHQGQGNRTVLSAQEIHMGKLGLFQGKFLGIQEFVEKMIMAIQAFFQNRLQSFHDLLCPEIIRVIGVEEQDILAFMGQ